MRELLRNERPTMPLDRRSPVIGNALYRQMRNHMIQFQEAIESILGKNDPDLTDIIRMKDYCLSIPFETFYEPVSIVDGLSGKKRKLINLSPEMVNAWAKHVCYSSRVRMINFEEAALSEISQGRLIPAMVLIRSHLEAAGLACLCNDEIRNWIKTQDASSIQELIPPTFLGTSLYRAKNKDERVEDVLFLSEQDKVPTSKIVSAFDNFFSKNDPTGRAHALYGLLCEYTHPNMRAVKDHIDVENDEVEGWRHNYRLKAKLVKEHYLMALNSLRCSMKAGHSACEMLRRTEFGYDGENGYIVLPNNDDLREIWEMFVKWPELTQDDEESV